MPTDRTHITAPAEPDTTGHDHATGFPIFAADAVLEVRTPAPETWTGAEWNAHVTAATSNRNGVPERLVRCPKPVCTTTCPARLNPSLTTPAEPDTDAILDALTAAGLTVTGRQIEADSVDIHLAHRSHPDYAGTALSWRPDGQGWYLLPVDPDDDAETVLPDYLGLTTPAFIAEAITEAVEVPATIPDLTALRGVIRALTAAGWVADTVTAMSDGSRVHDYLHPTGRGITVQVHQGGTVELTLTDLTRDQAVGAIGGAGLAPTAEVAATLEARQGGTR